jgi:hypothetical protein
MATYTSFADAYANAGVGTIATVSDGTDAPSLKHNTREYQEWRSRNFDGEIVSKIAGPPKQLEVTLAGWDVTVTITEPTWQGADVTAMTAPRQTLSKYAQTIHCDHTGAVKAGQFPFTVNTIRYYGQDNVSADASWVVQADDPLLDGTIIDGLITVDTAAEDCTIYITSEYLGVSLTDAVVVSFVNDAPPPPPSGSTTITSASASTFNLINSTSHEELFAPLTVTAPNATTHELWLNGQPQYRVDATSVDQEGKTKLALKWQYRLVGDTTWIDAASEEVGSYTKKGYDASGNWIDLAGFELVLQDISASLVQGSNYEFRMVARIESTGSASTPSVDTAQAGPFCISGGYCSVYWEAR